MQAPMIRSTAALVAFASIAACTPPQANSSAAPSPVRAPDASATVARAVAQAPSDAIAPADARARRQEEDDIPMLRSEESLTEVFPTAAALCPAPLECDLSRRTFETGPFREAVVLRARNNPDAATFALKTARGWVGHPLNPQFVAAFQRSPHTPGSTVIDLALATTTDSTLEIPSVSRSRSTLAGAGAPSINTTLSVFRQSCRLDERNVARCFSPTLQYSKQCTDGQCTERGARPAGLTD